MAVFEKAEGRKGRKEEGEEGDSQLRPPLSMSYLHSGKTQSMNLRRSLFWDTDYDKIDWDYHAPYVVDRVMQMGTLEEFREILTYYGKERIREIVKNLRYMDRRPMHFASAYFDIPLEEMRCYIMRQSGLLHWDY